MYKLTAIGHRGKMDRSERFVDSLTCQEAKEFKFDSLLMGRHRFLIKEGYPARCPECKNIVDLVSIPNSHRYCEYCIKDLWDRSTQGENNGIS